jgi:hypothetical protein
VKDPDFAKQNNRDPAASPVAYLPTKLLKQGFDVTPRQATAYRTGEDQLKGALVLPLHSTTVLPLGTRCGYLSTVCGIQITLPLSGRQWVFGGEAESSWWPVHSRGLLASSSTSNSYFIKGIIIVILHTSISAD